MLYSFLRGATRIVERKKWKANVNEHSSVEFTADIDDISTIPPHIHFHGGYILAHWEPRS